MLTVFWNRRNLCSKLWQCLICRGIVIVFQFLWIQSALSVDAWFKNKVNIFVKNLVSVPFVISFKGCCGNCEFYNFLYAKKKNLQDAAVTVFWVSSKLHSPSCASCAGWICRIERWRFGSLCHRCIQIIFFTYDALTVIGRQFWRSDKCLILVCKNIERTIFWYFVPSFILLYFASVKFVSNLLTNFPPFQLLKRRVEGLLVLACASFIKDHIDTATIRPSSTYEYWEALRHHTHNYNNLTLYGPSDDFTIFFGVCLLFLVSFRSLNSNFFTKSFYL